MHVIAAKAVAFKEALEPEFKEYMNQVITNANVLAQTMMERGFEVVSGGTKNHLMLVSLVKQGLTGKAADAALHSANITVIRTQFLMILSHLLLRVVFDLEHQL